MIPWNNPRPDQLATICGCSERNEPAKLVLDEEPEARLLLEFREARSKGQNAFAFRDCVERYTIGPIDLLSTDLVRPRAS